LLGELGNGGTFDYGSSPFEMGNYLPFVNFDTIQLPHQVVAGDDGFCSISQVGNVKCWGRNDDGQLGYEDSANRGDESNEMGEYLPFVNVGTGRTVVTIDSGQYFNCAQLDSLMLKCWGHGSDGQLGSGDVADIGTFPNQMGNYLQSLNFPSGETVSELGLGYFHSGMISTTGLVFMWGQGQFGQLGTEATSNIGDGPGEMGNYLQSTQLGSGRTAIELESREYHTCAILDNYGLKCWGENQYGRLGYGDSTDRGDDTNEMGDNLEYVNLGEGIKSHLINLGKDFTCSISNDDSMICFGNNDQGQLGIGSTVRIGDGSNEMGDYLNPINLGTGIEIRMCFDYSPTSNPTFTPTIPSPTYPPTINPTSNPTKPPTFAPSLWPTFSPHLILLSTPPLILPLIPAFYQLSIPHIFQLMIQPFHLHFHLPLIQLLIPLMIQLSTQQHPLSTLIFLLILLVFSGLKLINPLILISTIHLLLNLLFLDLIFLLPSTLHPINNKKILSSFLHQELMGVEMRERDYL